MTSPTTHDPTRPGTVATTSTSTVAWFFAGAYLLAWSLWFLLAALAADTDLTTTEFIDAIEGGHFTLIQHAAPPWLLYTLTRILDFSFTIAGLVAVAVTSGRSGLRNLTRRLLHWRIPARWYALALSPTAFYGTSALVVNQLERGTPNLEPGLPFTLLFSWSAGLLVSLVLRGAMGEELGLRGFALPALQQHYTPTKAALIIGVAWAGWHAPVLLTRGPATAIVQAAVIIGLSFVLAWLFNGSGGSLLPTLLLHATQNWEEGFEEIFPAIIDTDWETLAAIPLVALIAFSIIAVTRPHRTDRTNP